jgi:hypothetical protein
LLQNVAMLVLGVLAPVLAVGLGLFLIALPFTGLQPLWEATKATTPILLACAVGALLLVNAVIGNGGDDAPRNRVLRWAALVLAVATLPLVGIAVPSRPGCASGNMASRRSGCGVSPSSSSRAWWRSRTSPAWSAGAAAGRSGCDPPTCIWR